jgi:uncharacterized Zn finger protein
MSWYRFAPYVTIAERKRKAAKEVAKLNKKGDVCCPVVIEGRTIANTFWGKAWCNHLESYSDYANRLPRGRTYVRNGSVIDLKVRKGEITALVSGSSIYKVKIAIAKTIADKWNKIVYECAGRIDSLIELLQGKFSKAVMQIMTHPEKGLFPHPKEIKLSCSCPDWADMCKHVAAVLYGVGARLDTKPEELFMLRQVDHIELIAKAGTGALTQPSTDQRDHMLDEGDLSSLFGIDIGDTSQKELSVSTQDKKPLKKKKPTKKLIKPVKKTMRKARAKTAKKVTTKKAPATRKKTTTNKKVIRKKATTNKKVIRKKATTSKKSLEKKHPARKKKANQKTSKKS